MAGGRARKINIRAVLNAIFYLLRTGCQWRLLPGEFPGWSTVYHYFQAWKNAGVWTCIQRSMYQQARRQAGRAACCPSVVIMDGQSVKTSERRHSRIRCAQAGERPQAPHFGGYLRAADCMQSGASRHLWPKGDCPVARWPEAIIPEHSHSHP
jgi:transposase